MSVILRPLERKDVPKVLSLFGKLSYEMTAVPFAEIAAEEQIAEWIDREDTYVYVAADGDVILAVIRAKRGVDAKSHAATIALAVDESFGGQKFASQLTAFCAQALKDEGVKIMRAFVFSNNHQAIQTVLRCDFTLSGSVRKHHVDVTTGRYIDDLIFYKELD